MVLGNLIGGFIIILVGVNLMPSVADQVSAAVDTNGTNVTGAAATITDLVTLFFALGIMASAVQIAVTALREAGML